MVEAVTLTAHQDFFSVSLARVLAGVAVGVLCVVSKMLLCESGLLF